MSKKYNYVNLSVGFLVIVLVIVIASNVWYFNKNKQALENKVYGEFNIYSKIIKTDLVNDLQKILLGNNHVYNNNLIFNIRPSLSLNHSETIKFTPYSIEIIKNRNHISIDMISLKEYLKNLLPSYVCYQVIFANSEIVRSCNQSSKYNKNFLYDLGKNVVLEVKFNIEETYYKTNKNEVLIQSIKFLFISSVIVIVIASIHIKIMSIIKKIRSDLEGKEEIISNYKKNIEIHNDINQKFIQTATAMYLKEVDDSKITQLFPLLLIEKLNNRVSLLELKRVLCNYFFGSKIDIKVNINHYTSNVSFPIGKVALYQLIISIISNIIAIIQDQTDQKRFINLIINAHEVKFEFCSFPLSIEKLKNLSKIMYENNPTVFILDFARIINSLEEHGVPYTLNQKGNVGTLIINFLQIGMEDNVIQFFKKSR